MDSDADNACPETCNVCDSPAQVIETDVVIIGAGVAGIRAAERIAEIDPSLDVSVLEASERIGGRTYTEFNVGVEGNQWTIENGANWVYRNTSFYDRAVALSVETKAQELFSIVLYSYVPCVDETGDRGNKRVLSESHLQRFLDALEAENVSTHKKMHYQRLLRRLAEEGPAEVSLNSMILKCLLSLSHALFLNYFSAHLSLSQKKMCFLGSKFSWMGPTTAQERIPLFFGLKPSMRKATLL
jgi:hypothetical protein